MASKDKDQPVDRTDHNIDLSETRKGLDFMDVAPPRPGIELINQPVDAVADADNSQATPQASTAQPPADYAD